MAPSAIVWPMTTNPEAAPEVGDLVTLTTTATTSDGDTYLQGEVGEVIALARLDSTVLVYFDDERGALDCTPGDDCVVGVFAVA